jgi:biopolymer transport protein ExbD
VIVQTNHAWIIGAAALLTLCGCERASTPTTPSTSATAQAAPEPTMPVLKIQVFADGTIRAVDAPATLQQLDQILAKHASDGGVVWYYREAAQAEPHENAMQVIQLIIKHQLSISMSSKPDFSDYIDGEGNSKPRR